MVIKKVFSAFKDGNEFFTTDEKEAQQCDTYSIAKIEELEESIAWFGVLFSDIIVELKEGFFKWFEIDYEGDGIEYEGWYSPVSLQTA